MLRSASSWLALSVLGCVLLPGKSVRPSRDFDSSSAMLETDAPHEPVKAGFDNKVDPIPQEALQYGLLKPHEGPVQASSINSRMEEIFNKWLHDALLWAIRKFLAWFNTITETRQGGEEIRFELPLEIEDLSCTLPEGVHISKILELEQHNFQCTLYRVKHGAPDEEKTATILAENDQALKTCGADPTADHAADHAANPQEASIQKCEPWHYKWMVEVGELELDITLEWGEGLKRFVVRTLSEAGFTKLGVLKWVPQGWLENLGPAEIPELKKLEVHKVGLSHVTLNTQFLKVKKRTMVKEKFMNGLKKITGIGHVHTSLLTNWDVLTVVEGKAPPPSFSPTTVVVKAVDVADVKLAWFSKGQEHEHAMGNINIKVDELKESLSLPPTQSVHELGEFLRQVYRFVFIKAREELMKEAV